MFSIIMFFDFKEFLLVLWNKMKTITVFHYYLFSFKWQYSNNSKYHEYLNELNY